MIHSPGVLEVLEKSPLFHGVSSDTLFEKLNHTRLQSLKTGEVLLVPGQANNKIYMILSGRVNIQSNASRIDPLAILGEGECVGEMSVLGGAPVSAYAIAATDCKLLVVDQSSIWELINSSHDAAHNMLNILSDRVRLGNQIMAESSERRQGFAGNSIVDEMTGLYNQNWMQQKLNRLLHRGIVDNRTSCLLILEIDRFQEFCEKYGQLGGDQAMRDIAHTMLSCLRPDDHAGRHFGKRFVAYLQNTSLEDACIVAERLRKVVNESLVVLPNGDALPPNSISLGLGQVYPDDTLVRLLTRADKALLLAKESGGNCVKLVESVSKTQVA
jgi:diguanylate cyclase (GGDEF)-like protein